MLTRIMEIYSWIVASVIMFFIATIANFYQKKFGKKTFYYYYSIPIIILLVSAIHLFYRHTVLTEFMELMGAASAFLASYYLYRLMVGVRK
ncbi:MAG: hypothetical protein J5U17_02060 [Candidatus Methanoperedens sp.]|nr:hypothetical protein [Candidatus Methanoperedens sp.]